MKKILILAPNWIPSNLVGVQRPRLIANFLKELGWQPIILAVEPECYKAPIVPELSKTVSSEVMVHHVKAWPFYKPNSLVSDSSMRGFFPLIKRAQKLIKQEKIDFMWVPLPPMFSAVIGRVIHSFTGIPYAIDYTDPWVTPLPAGTGLFSKLRMVKLMAGILEPFAVKKASLLLGVSEQSYLPVIERNPYLARISCGAMPLGFDPDDYRLQPDESYLLWGDNSDILPLIYAGAFLPKSHYYVDKMFKAVAELRNSGQWNSKVKFYFVGTGHAPGKSIIDYAERYQIADIVTEIRERISYLQVLDNLSKAYGVLAIGNTEIHYTASKIYQTLLSERPVFAIFHEASTVNDVLKEVNATTYLVNYNNTMSEAEFEQMVKKQLLSFMLQDRPWLPDLSHLDKYSARESTRFMIEKIEKVLAL